MKWGSRIEGGLDPSEWQSSIPKNLFDLSRKFCPHDLRRCCPLAQCCGRGTQTLSLTSRRASSGSSCCQRSGTQRSTRRCTVGASIRASLAPRERRRRTHDASRCVGLRRLTCETECICIVLCSALWSFSRGMKHAMMIPSVCSARPCVCSCDSRDLNFH